jgi:hypothetical protein
MRSKVVLAALALACSAAAPALADDCGPLKLLTSVEMTPGPGGARMFVPVSVNGAPKKFMIDTAGAISTLTAAAASGMNLRVRDSDSVRLLDASGNASRKYVTLDSFQLGNLKGTGTELMISANPNAGTANAPFDGTLAGDMMARYDVELDFAARTMSYFSPDHCEGHVVHWTAPVVAAVPFAMYRKTGNVPGLRENPAGQDTHIRVPVTLDGKNFMATLATGAVRSTMSAKTAEFAFGLTADSPGSVPLGTVDGNPQHKVFGHVFKTLTFDGVTVNNPHIAIIPDLMGSKDPDNTVATGSMIQHVDDGLASEVTIGMDVLKQLHLYIAYKERKLYITPAQTQAAQAQ